MKKILSKRTLSLLLAVLFIVPLMFLATACGENDATVARVSTYDELVEALSGDKEVIRLEKDMNLDKSIYISRKVTFDLNGKTLKGDGYDGVFYISVGGDLTIKGKGNVIAKGGFDANDTNHEHEYAMAVWANGGKVTINGGKFSQITVNGDDQYDMIYASNKKDDNNEIHYGEITILSGEFESVTPQWTLNLKDSDNTTSKMVVKGGTFVKYNPAESQTEPAGTPANFVADGYKAELIEGTNNYKVVKEV